jgi:hypothetical protein
LLLRRVVVEVRQTAPQTRHAFPLPAQAAFLELLASQMVAQRVGAGAGALPQVAPPGRVPRHWAPQGLHVSS